MELLESQETTGDQDEPMDVELPKSNDQRPLSTDAIENQNSGASSQQSTSERQLTYSRFN